MNRQTYVNAMNQSQQMNAARTIAELLDTIVAKNS